MAIPKITHEQYTTLLDLVMVGNSAMLVVGPPGVGKTRAVKQYCQDKGIDLIVEHPGIAAPQDIKGLPSKSTMRVEQKIEMDDLLAALGVDDEEQKDEIINIAEFLPFGQMLKVLTATRPTILFYDDFGQAPDSVQAALMQVIGDREIVGRKIPDCVKIIGATNGKEHKAGVKGLLEPIKSRFGRIVELVPDLPGFRKYAKEHGVYPMVQLFLEYQPESFNVFRTDLGMEQSPNPRLWEKLSGDLYLFDSVIGTSKDHNELREIEVRAHIGEAVGRQYAAFERLQHKIPSYEDIINDPEEYPINQPLDIRFALLGMLAVKGKTEHSSEVFQYTNKMAKEYQVVFFRLLRQHNPDMVNTDAGQMWWMQNLSIYLD